jgi:metallophosphoesterase (TIGR03767 family)
VLGVAALAAALLAVGVSGSQAGTSQPSVTGRSTLEVTICPTRPLCPPADFTYLRTGPGEGHVVRQELAPAKSGRAGKRSSLAYFAQISDFQLADEESPARVEAIDDEPSGFASSAWRPQEAMVPHESDRTIRQLNRFLRSPIPQAGGARASLLNAVLTGDLADSMQRNETQWVVRLLEGGTLDPSSGTTDRNGAGCQGAIRDVDNPRKYTGVQDYDDFPSGEGDPNFYDPDEPELYDDGTWPEYKNLMNRAQAPFQAEGLKVPSYVAFGNHDNLVQGNEDASFFIENIATGCIKPLLEALPGARTMSERDFPDGLPPFADALKRAFDRARKGAGAQGGGQRTLLVPRDENRQFVDKVQSKRLYNTGKQADQHGFAFVDQAELTASRGNASYYDFSPKPGIRNVIVDSVSEGGRTPDSSEGNIDDPQFRWLERTLAEATRRDELIFVYGHHAPSSSQEANVPDEEAAACTGNDEHGHDVNPGCDRDPRLSTPIHNGDDTIALLHRFPHVVAYVAGHSHDNVVTPLRDGRGGGFWEIKSPAIADWTTHHRLLEIMDNQDGTLSLFGTMLDLDAPVRAPGSQNAAAFGPLALASLGRTLTYNDPQQGPDGSQGGRDDRNVELLLDDPRRGDGGGGGGGHPPINGTGGDDELVGTSGDDVINCGAGNDTVFAGAGNDIVNCGSGNDEIHGGSGHDTLRGEEGDDRLFGDSGDDRLDGGPGNDQGSGGSGTDTFAAVEDQSQD